MNLCVNILFFIPIDFFFKQTEPFSFFFPLDHKDKSDSAPHIFCSEISASVKMAENDTSG